MSKVVEDVIRQLTGRRLDEEEIKAILEVLSTCYVPSQTAVKALSYKRSSLKEGRG